MSKVWAIDIGTDCTVIAVNDDHGRTSLKAASDQSKYEPSALAYDAKHVRWYSGYAAIGDPGYQVVNVKELLSGQRSVMINGLEYDWENLVQRFITGLCEQTGQAKSEPPDTCAFVVPWTLSTPTRHSLKNIAKTAGIQHPLLVNDAEAIIAGYELHKHLNEQRPYLALVADLGAGGFRFSIMEITKNRETVAIELIATTDYEEDAQTGLSATLKEFIKWNEMEMIAEWQPGWCNPELPRQICDILESDTAGNTDQEDNEDFAIEVRRHFEKKVLAADKVIKRILKDASIFPDKIDFVLCAGGGTELSSFTSELLASYGRPMATPVGRRFRDIGVYGAAALAYQAYQHELGDATVEDRPKYQWKEYPSVGVELDDGTFDRILDLGSEDYTRTRRFYQVPTDVTNSLEIVMREGFARRAISNRTISNGRFTRGINSERKLLKLQVEKISAHEVRVELSNPNNGSSTRGDEEPDVGNLQL